MQGLEKNRFALINKTHHALVDGVSGVDIATVLFDVKPVPEQTEPEHAWVPEPAPVLGRAGGARRPGAGRDAVQARPPRAARGAATR